MKFTLNWLKNHLETTASLSDITDALTSLGLEVESVSDETSRLAAFTVAEIVATEQHPNADRLKVCRVNTGAETLQIVCGAPNARAGLKTVLARMGVVIPSSGVALKPTAIRGIDSQGMLCSAEELCLGGDSSGIMELPASATAGALAAAALGLDDPVIEIAITPNRGDCLGIHGIARDLAAKGIGRLKPWNPTTVTTTGGNSVAVHISDPALCPLFALQQVTGVTNGASPEWLAQRLTAVGQRPQSLLVDITNFLCLGLGRPLHVFDADKVNGDIRIHAAAGGEAFAGLNGQTYTMPAGAIVISDATGVISLAGIMGGASTAVDAQTTNVLVESALFDPLAIADAGRKLNILSDARYRFERSVDPATTLPGLHQAVALILEHGGGTACPVIQVGAPPALPTAIPFNRALVAQRGGLELTHTQIDGYLNSLGFTVSDAHVTPPTWRPDVTIAEDLVEEVLRLAGYDAIPAVPLPVATRPAQIPAILNRVSRMRRALVAAGYHEAVTWSFTSHDLAVQFGGGDAALALANPISADLAHMRPSLLPNLLLAATHNTDRSIRGNRLFEIGAIFQGVQPGGQELVACAVTWGMNTDNHWARKAKPVSVYTIKQAAQQALQACGFSLDGVTFSPENLPAWYHPTRSSVLLLGKTVVGVVGELHPGLLSACNAPSPIAALELYLERLPFAKQKAVARPALQTSDFQPVNRDFAFIVDAAQPADSLVKCIRQVDRQMITQVTVFDVYQGTGVADGKKSLAVSVRLEPRDKTLTEEDLTSLSTKIVDAAGKLGATLRV